MMDLFGVFFFPFLALGMIVGLILKVLLLAFWIWMIIDVAQRKFKNRTEWVVWILVVVLLNWVGALVYYFVIRANNPKGLKAR